ncbi:TIM21 [Lepeophtheirus salmonis]|uniref:Mitochondrial import inner membrane translocase subunit Tim21 n=1 Tax=Lepeophtheirus salmonis TaxID=72036 RepID=A0A7R8D217_LEPSM|nr:TIM21 [Lepeophtheirus salmonis]CAF3001308.1 TIM21 [Lepeophtheirus salmonis]
MAIVITPKVLQWVIKPNCLFRRSISLTRLRYCNGKKELDFVKSQHEDKTMQTTFAKTAKENARYVGYGSIVLLGIGVTGALLYTLGTELFSTDSPIVIYQTTSDRCMAHPKVQDLLGMPIKSFGGKKLAGEEDAIGIVQVDARDDGSGTLKVRFIIVTTDDMLQRSVVVEDNTQK